MYDEFKKQLSQNPEAGMKRIYSGKRNILHLTQISLEVSLGQLNSLLSNRKRNDQFKTCNDVVTRSPFIWEGTRNKHLENHRDSFEKMIKIIEIDMYVDHPRVIILNRSKKSNKN